uniref:F-box only protein 50-like n=1 Tax=Podarcis muralis TaxID=64176 RepID=UPI0010A07D4D
WCVKQQHIDLVAEGFWEELLDSYQPNFTVMDWYENSKLADSVYELHVRLLGADRATVLGEFHHVAHEARQDRQENKNWHHVSHVFQRYGAGLRYVHFLHKAKEVETPAGFLRTRVTDSSVSAQLRTDGKSPSLDRPFAMGNAEDSGREIFQLTREFALET